MKNIKAIQSIKWFSFSLVLGLLLGGGLIAVKAWTPAPPAPPAGNVGAPINVGNTGQFKQGNLILNTGGTWANGLIVARGNVGIGTAVPTEKLDVVGNIKGTQLCIGNDCRNAWPTGVGGITGSGTVGYIPKWTGGTALGDSIIQESGGGGVGIGGTPGIYTLKVNGSTYMTGGLTVDGATNLLKNDDVISTSYAITGNKIRAGSGSTAAQIAGSIVAESTITATTFMESLGSIKANVKMRSPSYCDVNGINCRSLTAAGWVASSDERLKKNISEIDNVLEKVSQIRGVTYNWKDENMGTDTEVGVIAQEVEKVFPQLVFTDPNTGLKSVSYEKLTPVLIEAVKELKTQKDEEILNQQQQIDMLRNEIEALKSQR
ncbi:tail fiber domain-containing protein [Candidatus Parcubacteria bacterium]|nr:tail fiber domain-containing protein [Candidatus Parcubacteria bacterium]